MIIRGIKNYTAGLIDDLKDVRMLLIEMDRITRQELIVEIIAAQINLIEKGWGVDEIYLGYHSDFILREVISEWYYNYKLDYMSRPFVNEFSERVLKHWNVIEGLHDLGSLNGVINELDEYLTNYGREKRMIICNELSLHVFIKYNEGGIPVFSDDNSQDYRKLLEKLRDQSVKGRIVILTETRGLNPTIDKKLPINIASEKCDIHIRVLRNKDERKIFLIKHPTRKAEVKTITILKAEDKEREELLKEAFER